MNNRIDSSPRRLLLALLLLGVLFVVAWLPRATKLDSFVTPDEPRWLQRSANFFHALDQGDYASTYQTGHPGVTVMWAGTAGLLAKFPTYAKLAPRPLNEVEFTAWLRANSTISLLELLLAGRRWIVLAISLAIALTYLPLSSLLGSSTAFVAMLFVALEPFHIGLSRQLHPDGLMASLTLLALVTFLVWLYKRPRHIYLIFAGIATGLAILTKSPALILLFVMLLLTFVAWLMARQTPPRRSTLAWGGIQLVVYSVITCVLLWPATWSLLQAPYVRMVNLALEYAAQGHELPLFFWGKTIDDPGPLFYPVSFFMRTTPATLFGLLWALIALWRGWYPLHAPKSKQTIIALLIFATLYGVAISTSAKKMDRYLLPAMPALTIVATVGWIFVARLISHSLRLSALRAWRTHFTLSTRPVGVFARLIGYATLGVALVVLHALFSALHTPYYLTYYNPLFGGSHSAPQMMMIGWGEGLEKAAMWLNRQPLPSGRVVAWYGNGPLSFYLDPTTEVLDFYAGGDVTEEYWFDADYAVLYANQWQRENPSREIVDYFLARSPTYTVSFGGLDLVRIYALRDQPPPNFTHLHRIDTAIWGEKIELVGYYLRDTTIVSDSKIQLALFWRGTNLIEHDYSLQLSLVDPAGNAQWSTTRSPAGIETSDWPLGKLWRDGYALDVPTNLIPGNYELVATFQTPNGDILPLVTAAHGQDEPSTRQEMVVTTLRVQQPVVIDTVAAAWQGARIESVAYADSVIAGSTLIVDITASVETAAPLKLSLRLLSDAGETIAQNDQVLLPTMRFRLAIPEGISPGSYTLSTLLYIPDSLAALPNQEGLLSVDISKVAIE